MSTPGQRRLRIPRNAENTVLLGDAAAVMDRLPAGHADMIFADPPYNLQLGNGLTRPDNSAVHGVNDDWDKFASPHDYDAFTEKWLTAARRLLKDDGTIWVIGTYHNIYRVGTILQDLGFWILNDVVWRKANPMPNFRGTRFTNAHETMLWCSKGKDARYTFNYEAMKHLNDDVQMRSDWLLPLCSGNERLRDATGTKSHPTQKPEALLHRIVLASSRVGDLVVDPFFGSGTTGAVAKKLGRRYLGIENNQRYAEIARARLRRVRCTAEHSLLATPVKRELPRIPFGWLVERGLLEPGEVLYAPNRAHAARVRADGTLNIADDTGSIHQMGAAVQGAPACNGWVFWHVDVEGRLVPIDVLRQKLRAELN